MTLVPSNKIETAQPQAETTHAENGTQNAKNGYGFYCNKFNHFKAECRKIKHDKWQQTRENNGQTNSNSGNTIKCDTCSLPHKTEGCWTGANAANDLRPKRHKQQERKTDHSVHSTTTKTVEESKN